MSCGRSYPNEPSVALSRPTSSALGVVVRRRRQVDVQVGPVADAEVLEPEVEAPWLDLDDRGGAAAEVEVVGAGELARRDRPGSNGVGGVLGSLGRPGRSRRQRRGRRGAGDRRRGSDRRAVPPSGRPRPVTSGSRSASRGTTPRRPDRSRARRPRWPPGMATGGGEPAQTPGDGDRRRPTATDAIATGSGSRRASGRRPLARSADVMPSPRTVTPR